MFANTKTINILEVLKLLKKNIYILCSIYILNFSNCTLEQMISEGLSSDRKQSSQP